MLFEIAEGLPRPAEAGGPCTGPCGHAACHAVLSMACRLCAQCKRPLGFGVSVWWTETGAAFHIDCSRVSEKACREAPRLVCERYEEAD